jgi:hypothetical protein
MIQLKINHYNYSCTTGDVKKSSVSPEIHLKFYAMAVGAAGNMQSKSANGSIF